MAKRGRSRLDGTALEGEGEGLEGKVFQEGGRMPSRKVSPGNPKCPAPVQRLSSTASASRGPQSCVILLDSECLEKACKGSSRVTRTFKSLGVSHPS